jgi:hypothetical protein
MPGPGTITDTAPGQEPGNRHQGDKVLYTYEKPDLGNILDEDQQNAQKRVNMADGTHLQVREHEDQYMVRDDAVHEVTEYETTFEETPQQTISMDVKIELTHHMAEYNAIHMDTK